jgi:tRNA-uridine 2-sulfurtransferase
METKKIKVVVGISGGVDSSVAAYLLKEQGYDVHGVFIKTWSPGWLPCTWLDEKRDAMRICAALDIPFHFLDTTEAYKQDVADYMIEEYRKGNTPNPDVLCNRVIKFGKMWEFAQSLGATYIATGHYARTDGIRLYRGTDEKKDQSYFLWMIEDEELAHILFPLGKLQKNEVRAIAEKAGLFTSEKKDSQGICFLGDIDMKEFLSHYIEQKEGDVCDTSGKVIGRHDGVWFYTIGERHGWTLLRPSTEQKPYYVVGKDVEKNILIVDYKDPTKENTLSHTQTLSLTHQRALSKGADIHSGQYRYRGVCVPVRQVSEHTFEIGAPETLSVGQSLVLYDGNTLIGGGIIEHISQK